MSGLLSQYPAVTLKEFVYMFSGKSLKHVTKFKSSPFKTTHRESASETFGLLKFIEQRFKSD